MGLPTPVQVTRAQTSNEHPFEVKSAPTVRPRLNKIRFLKPMELPYGFISWMSKLSEPPEISKLIKELRVGNLIETAGALILIVVMWQIMGGWD